MKIFSLFKSLFSENDKSMFQHDDNGESCCVCGKGMKNDCMRVGSGEKMHYECWGDFFLQSINKLKK